jgi:hypothetical protein
VRDRVRVPTLGQHPDRDDAANLLAELSLLADRVHRLAQESGVIDIGDVGARIPPAELVLESLDLMCGVLLEISAERIAGLELDGVDQDRPLPRRPLSVRDVREQL